MKLQKFLIRIWLLITSAALFTGTWVVLAHSPKPVAQKTVNIPAMPVLQPIPSLEQFNSGQPLEQMPSFQSQQPMMRLRTRGS